MCRGAGRDEGGARSGHLSGRRQGAGALPGLSAPGPRLPGSSLGRTAGLLRAPPESGAREAGYRDGRTREKEWPVTKAPWTLSPARLRQRHRHRHRPVGPRRRAARGASPSSSREPSSLGWESRTREGCGGSANQSPAETTPRDRVTDTDAGLEGTTRQARRQQRPRTRSQTMFRPRTKFPATPARHRAADTACSRSHPRSLNAIV